MFKHARLVTALALAGTLLVSGNLARAAELTPTFDTDSYVFVGTNNTSSADITVTPYNQTELPPGFFGHYTFGVIQFDVASLTTADNKTLTLTVSGFESDATGGDIYLSYLDADYTDYLAQASGNDRDTWFETHVMGIALQIDNGSVSSLGQSLVFDVTDVVNDWVNGAKDNHGFGVWGLNIPGINMGAGAINFASSQAAFDGPRLSTVAVPEPASLILLAVGSASILTRRKRR